MKLKLRKKKYWMHGTIACGFVRLPLGTSKDNLQPRPLTE